MRTLLALVLLTSVAAADPTTQAPEEIASFSLGPEVHGGFPTGVGGLPVALAGTAMFSRAFEVSVGGMLLEGALLWGGMLRIATSPRKHAVTFGAGLARSITFNETCENCSLGTDINLEVGYRYLDDSGFLLRVYAGPRISLGDRPGLEPIPYGGVAIGWIFDIR